MPIQILRPDQLAEVKNDPTFRDVGAYPRDTVVASLDPFVPPAFLWVNPERRDVRTREQTELTDVMFWHESTGLLIECKAREIRDPDEVHDQKKLTRWLDKELSEARKQVQSALKDVQKTPVISGRAGAVDVIADLREVKQFIPAIVVFEITDFFWNPKIHARKMKYPDVQLFDLREFHLATTLLTTPPAFLSYLKEKQALSQRFPSFLPYEANLLLYLLANAHSLTELLESQSIEDLTRKFARGLPDNVRPSFLYTHSREEVYAALGPYPLAS